jgi:hypothetical protein
MTCCAGRRFRFKTNILTVAGWTGDFGIGATLVDPVRKPAADVRVVVEARTAAMKAELKEYQQRAIRLYNAAPASDAAQVDCGQPAPPVLGCGSIIGGYSLRSAVMGSTCSARIAGSAQATSEISTSTTGTTANVTTSCVSV